MQISQMEGSFENPMLFLLALKWNLYEKAFPCIKTKTNFCSKPCWNAEISNYLFISNWWITFFKHLYSLIMWQYIEINWLCKHRKKIMSSQTSISIFLYWNELGKVFPLSLNQSKYSLEAKNFLRGLRPLNALLGGSDSPAPLTLATLPFPLIIFPAGSYNIDLNIIKWHLTNLFSGESNIWYPSVTTRVQHFTKRSWTLQSFSFCSEKFLRVMLLIC